MRLDIAHPLLVHMKLFSPSLTDGNENLADKSDGDKLKRPLYCPCFIGGFLFRMLVISDWWQLLIYNRLLVSKGNIAPISQLSFSY
jgi:hypothetical protein